MKIIILKDMKKKKKMVIKFNKNEYFIVYKNGTIVKDKH